jgi:hypothetical protein
MSYFYKKYDSDFDITCFVDNSLMTVKELKTKNRIKIGSWSHPKNKYLIQTYKVEIHDPDTKEWVTLSESDIIDFTKYPRIKIKLIHSMESRC